MGKRRKTRAEQSLVQKLEDVRSQVQKGLKPPHFVFARDKQSGVAEILESDDVRLRGKGKKKSSHATVSWREDDLDSQFLASTIEKPIWGQLLNKACEANTGVADNWETCERLEESAGRGDNSTDDQKKIVDEYKAAFSDHLKAVASVDALFQLSDVTWDPYWSRMYSWTRSSRPIAVKSREADEAVDQTTDSLREKLNTRLLQSDLKHLVLRKLVMSSCGVPGKDQEEKDRNWFAMGKEVRFVGSHLVQHENCLTSRSKDGGKGTASDGIGSQTDTEPLTDDDNDESSTARFGRTKRKAGKKIAFEPASASAIIALHYDATSTPSLTVSPPTGFDSATAFSQDAPDTKETASPAIAGQRLNVDTMEDLPVEFSLKAPRVPIISELEGALTRMSEQCLEVSKEYQTRLRGMSYRLGISAYHSGDGAIECFMGLARTREGQKTALLSLPPALRMLRTAAERAVKAKLDAETKAAVELCSYPSTRGYAESWADVLSIGVESTLGRFNAGLSELAASIYKQEETARAAKGLGKSGTSQKDKQLQRDGARFAIRLKGKETELGLASSPNTFDELKETLRRLDEDCEESETLAAVMEMMSGMDDAWEAICERSESARALRLAEEAEEQATFEAVRTMMSDLDHEWERMCRHKEAEAKLDWAEEATAAAEEQSHGVIVAEADVTVSPRVPRRPRGITAVSLERRYPLPPVCPTPPVTSSVVDPPPATPPVFRFSRFPRSNHPSRVGSMTLTEFSSSGDTLVEWESSWLQQLSELLKARERGMILGAERKDTHVTQVTELQEAGQPSPWQTGAPSYADMLKAVPTCAEPESLIEIGDVDAALRSADQPMGDRAMQMVTSHEDEDSIAGHTSNRDVRGIPPETQPLETDGVSGVTVEYHRQQSRGSGLEHEVEPEAPQGQASNELKTTVAWRAAPIETIDKRMRWDEEYFMHNTREYSRRLRSSLEDRQEDAQTLSLASASEAGVDRRKMKWDEEYYDYNRSLYPASGTRLAGMSRLGHQRSSRRRELRRAAVGSWLSGFTRGRPGGGDGHEETIAQRGANSLQGDGS